MKKVNFFVFLALLSSTLANAETNTTHNKTGSKPLIDLFAEMKKPAEQKTIVDKVKPVAIPKAKEQKTKLESSSKKINWSYSGKGKPAFWGELSEKYSDCKTGKHQSPINLIESKSMTLTGLEDFDVFYRDAALKIKNNGHTVQVDYPLGSYILVNQHRYELLQFHFHTPSEHQLNGFNYPMEMHLVHKNADGDLAVIGIIFQEGEKNLMLQKIIRKAESEKSKAKLFTEININPSDLYPPEKMFYKYSGSLTTPPCSQGVYWMVFKNPVSASASQLKRMNDIMGDNHRPVQKHHARTILKSWHNKSPDSTSYQFY